MTTITHRTGNAAINWIIDRCKFSNIARNDEELIYVIGEFNGSLPYRMAKEIKEFGRKNGGDNFTGTMRCYKLFEVVDLEDKTIHTANISWGFGSFKGTATKISFTIVEEMFALSDEDIAEITA